MFSRHTFSVCSTDPYRGSQIRSAVSYPTTNVQLGKIFAFSANVLAERAEGCLPAVDAAESLDMNQSDTCDYSKEALNGYLHQAFTKNKKQETTSAESQPVVKSDVGAKKMTHEAGVIGHQFKQEVDQWVGVTLARNQMLPKILALCPKGFRVIAEEYQPLPMGRIELRLIAQCIEQ